MLVEFVHFVTERGKRSTYRRRRSEVEAESLEVVPLSSEWREVPEPRTVHAGQSTGWAPSKVETDSTGGDGT